MKTLSLIMGITVLTLAACSHKSNEQTVANNENSKTEMKTETYKISITGLDNVESGQESGVSGAFIGVADGKIIQAGGCNFPVEPMAPDSKKKFYEGIYVVEFTNDTTWQPKRIGTLPQAMAYGAAVSLPEGIVLIGGNDGSKSYPDVRLLKLTDNGSELIEMATLPVAADNIAATAIDSTIYVAGGSVDGQPSNRVFCLDLKTSEKWEELPSMPGNPRVQPVVAHGKDSLGNEHLYVWGGFAGKGKDRDASLNTDGLKYDFATKTWTTLPAPTDSEGTEVSTGGGFATILPDGKIAVEGGVNKDIFLAALQNQAPDYLQHPIGWYKFNPNLLIFDPSTEQWTVALTSEELARAGAGMVAANGGLYVSGGELKPRIRTAEIVFVK